jgi:hypothetical protein
LQEIPFYKFLLITIRRNFYTNLFSIFFYSSFFTSVWVWLYVVSSVLIRMMQKVRRLWAEVLPFLEIEKKPLVAIGRVAGILVGSAYATVLGIVWLGHHWR